MIENEAAARDWLAQRSSAQGLARLEAYAALLVAENARQNLVAANTIDALWQRHVVDSAQLLMHVPRGTGPWLDLGSGPGLPGLVIAALEPDRPVVLCESRRLRSDWLREAADHLGLSNVTVAAHDVKAVDRFDAAVISARAFAPLEKLLSLSARFSTSDTVWVLPKGRSAAQELASIAMKWRHTFHVEQSLTSADAGIIVGTLEGRKGKNA